MTAEIAILNRAAVTLAADSAVTIGRGSSAKIYNTVNKIFELHETEPVGIMIYGSLNFMGLPIETLVKLYRKQRRQTKFDTIVGYRDDFIKWLETEVPVEEQHEWQNAYLICTDILSLVNRNTKAEIHRQMMKSGKYLKSKDNGIAQKIIAAEIAHLKQCDKLDNCKNGYAKDLEAFYGNAIRLCIDNANLDFSPNKQTKTALMRLCIEKLARKSLTSFRTGFVIAGFGRAEICPSLESFEADGIVRGKLKYVSHYSVDIGRKGPHAEIYGFAQDDMIMSFLNGIDPSLDKYIESSMSEAVDKLSSTFYQAINPAGGAIPAAAKAVLDQIKNDALKKFREYKDREFTKRVKDLIGVMPKQEISNLARSLIDLTTLKRRVTRDQESVGGEVDVAIISKSEGFVWVKRKHYFPAELNQRFFAKHYKEV
jgi:hypothetical protein